MRNQDRSTASPSQNPDAAVSQLARYMTEAAEAGTVSRLDFWSSRRASYSSIQPLAEDLLAAPASQAFVERVFFSCYVAFLLLFDAIELTNRWKCVYFLNLMDTCNWTCMDYDSVMMQQLVMIMMIQTVNEEKN